MKFAKLPMINPADLTRAELSVLYVLCAHQDFNTNKVSIGRRRLARLAGLSNERYVNAAIGRLKDTGVLQVLEDGTCGRGKRSIIEIIFPEVNPFPSPVSDDDEIPSSAPVIPSQIPAQGTAFEGQKIPSQGTVFESQTSEEILAQAPGNTGADNTEILAQAPGNTGARGITYENTSDSFQTSSNTNTREGDADAPAGADGALFDDQSPPRKRSYKPTAKVCERIYAACPIKVGRDAALTAIGKALTKLTSEPPADADGQSVEDWLLGRVQTYAAARARCDEFATSNPTAFVPRAPHPATWFNQARYLDDPKTWEPPTRRDRREAAKANQFSEKPTAHKSFADRVREVNAMQSRQREVSYAASA